MLLPLLPVFLGAVLPLRSEARPEFTWRSEQEHAATCGYNSCPQTRDDMMNVHLIPHTHDDVGWLKTVDQYYYGDQNSIQTAGVQYILDSVIPELLRDPSKRFIYVEVAFFAKWWREQDNATRESVQNLVNQGRLEFILGGWCMNDEASTHYNAIIDQHTLGFEFLRQNFGDCGRPRVAWQIDPFGHSREQASLFAQMGYDGLFIGRLDHADKDLRLNQTNMEFVWRGSPNNLGKTARLFTGVLYNGYGPPSGFCWDISCKDDPIMDDDRLNDNNVNKKVADFIKAAHDQMKHYHTNSIMMTMGSDFQYQNAHTWFKNMDKLIKYVNAQQSNGSDVNVFYSTPSCYLAERNQLNQLWNSKADDFFPYSDHAHSYWTGYFSSRPALKENVRRTNNFLQVCKQVAAFNGQEVNKLKEAMAVVQHHDAISGTEKQHVADDYAQRLAVGVKDCQMMLNAEFSDMLTVGSSIGPPEQNFCPLLNISKCSLTENYNSFVVLAYNPLGREVLNYFRIPVLGTNYQVTDKDGTRIPAQLIPVSNATRDIPERKGTRTDHDLVFRGTLPALGFYLFFVQYKEENVPVKENVPHEVEPKADIILKNKHLSLTFDGTTGKIRQMQQLEDSISIGISQDYMYYLGYHGNNSKDDYQNSGAYIFRPNGSLATNFSQTSLKTKEYITFGDALVREVHQQFSPWVSQVVRLYEEEKYAEFEWTIGPIPIEDGYGKEVISRFSTNLNSFDTFYTDANGREILQRRYNHRDTWVLNQTEDVAGNYYPVNSRIFIRDEAKNVQFTVLTDRSQGGASLRAGSLELMVHRRLLADDHRGVGEPLNETGSDGRGLIIRGKHYVFLETIAKSARCHRDLALKLYMAPSLSFMIGQGGQQVWIQNWGVHWTAMKTPLPANVHLLTLEKWPTPGVDPLDDRGYLLRLEHIYEVDEDPALSQPVTLDLNQIFKFGLQIVNEVTLGANMPLSQLRRMEWTVIVDKEVSNTVESVDTTLRVDNTTITLNPMQIRTFIVNRLEG
ncbi:lysosomal alpha-mannosidase-like [Mizuhopecten yessoensis]|uniref:Alpha-mannosidase n=1 Tax=Mizuhopecten yessoensis TaxID=6573 RepID=A0A210QA98_MIZYE|nr:lysosomal alpha-mannosidase-like [Mizuhopecten yessoensis]OWF45656.1 Lysosomal alpha-mannosidase [Mizuhopecten yessoensis]